MFLGKDSDGEYILDANETPVTEFELMRADDYLKTWEGARPPYGIVVTQPCPHRAGCRSRRECLGKIAWWRRYIREIEIEGR